MTFEEQIEKQSRLIEYMRNVVKAYTDTYQSIGAHLKEMDDAGDDEPAPEMDDEIMLCFDQIQPILTLYEDTKPENIDKTLAGHSASLMQKIGNRTLN
jgi:hypothetical protein